MKIWPFYEPKYWGGYLGASRPMLLCVTLCPLINCPKTVKILAVKGLKIDLKYSFKNEKSFYWEIFTILGNGWTKNIDTTKSSSANGNIKRAACSTSDYADLVPTLCTPGFLCDIRRAEDRSRGIPNRGECIKDPYKGIYNF